MPATVHIYPYKVDESLLLQASDPYDPTDSALDLKFEKRGGSGPDSALTLDMTRVPTWREIRCRVACVVSPMCLAEIAPDLASDPKGLDFLVSVRCAATKVRRVFSLESHPGGLWSGEIALRRGDLRGRAELQPRLCRKRDATPGHLLDTASRSHAIVALGPPVAVTVDESWSPAQSPLDIAWEDFGASKNSWRREHDADVFQIDIGSSRPKVWLNAKYGQLKSVLDSTIRTGPTAATRLLLELWVAHSCWIQLFYGALSLVEVEETTGDITVKEEWAKGLLTLFLPTMYPGEATVEDAMRVAREASITPDQSSTITGLVATPIMSLLKAHSRMTESLRAAESRGDD